MRLHHFHFGKDGGTERFYIHLVNALARRGVRQLSYIRPDRPWRPKVENATEIVETHYRRLSLDRLTLPARIGRRISEDCPAALLAWTPKAARLLPSRSSALRVARLGDYPPRLDYYRNVDILVCNAPDIADHVRRLGWTGRMEVISNFTTVERVTPARRIGPDAPDRAFLVMAMGRLIRRKGFDILIEALAKLPHVHLWLAGEGEERSRLEAQAHSLGISDRIRFLGWQQDVRPYVAACDAFVIPSRFEPLGNVVLEAWAQARPVISTRSQGPAWFMRDGTNGLLVDIDDTDRLAAAINRLSCESDLRCRLVEGGRNTTSQLFSEQSIVNAYMKLFTGSGSVSEI